MSFTEVFKPFQYYYPAYYMKKYYTNLHYGNPIYYVGKNKYYSIWMPFLLLYLEIKNGIPCHGNQTHSDQITMMHRSVLYIINSQLIEWLTTIIWAAICFPLLSSSSSLKSMSISSSSSSSLVLLIFEYLLPYSLSLFHNQMS